MSTQMSTQVAVQVAEQKLKTKPGRTSGQTQPKTSGDNYHRRPQPSNIFKMEHPNNYVDWDNARLTWIGL